MDTIKEKQRLRSKQILCTLKKGTMSTKSYDSTSKPWYMKDKPIPFDIGYESISDCPPDLNYSIILMYKVIGDPDREVYVGDWTIIAWNNAKKKHNEYKDDKQTKVFDIAYKYMGMGHIRVLACDLTTHKLFYHDAGGANGYESQDNYDKLLKLDPSTLNQRFFREWFHEI
jgi:hypothetical protein